MCRCTPSSASIRLWQTSFECLSMCAQSIGMCVSVPGRTYFEPGTTAQTLSLNGCGFCSELHPGCLRGTRGYELPCASSFSSAYRTFYIMYCESAALSLVCARDHIHICPGNTALGSTSTPRSSPKVSGVSSPNAPTTGFSLIRPRSTWTSFFILLFIEFSEV